MTMTNWATAARKRSFVRIWRQSRVLKECEFEHRLATPEEQKILSEYVGWGSLADAFDESKAGWANEYRELVSHSSLMSMHKPGNPR